MLFYGVVFSNCAVVCTMLNHITPHLLGFYNIKNDDYLFDFVFSVCGLDFVHSYFSK